MLYPQCHHRSEHWCVLPITRRQRNGVGTTTDARLKGARVPPSSARPKLLTSSALPILLQVPPSETT